MTLINFLSDEKECNENETIGQMDKCLVGRVIRRVKKVIFFLYRNIGEVEDPSETRLRVLILYLFFFMAYIFSLLNNPQGVMPWVIPSCSLGRKIG